MIEHVTKEDHDRLVVIWESSVKATHHFLDRKYFEYIKSRIPSYSEYVDLFGYRDDQGVLQGFLGVAGGKIEMLFIDSHTRGGGIGKKLLAYAVEELKATKLDVNEQNEQGVGFYLHMGFV